MDDQALIRTYGNTDLPEGTRDRPLVTFALFAYNQEKYIREAVEGAFSQTYSPLEIILSDDCSSDRTFEIMEEMAREYRGPHTVRVRRNDVNLGTSLHVQMSFAQSMGRLFIVAAGDDISVEERVEKIVAAWLKNCCGPALLHSGMVQFENERCKVKRVRRLIGADGSLKGFVSDWKMPALAPTCAYSREIFEHFPPLSGGSLIEDLPLMVRSLAIARLIYVDEPLVFARKLPCSAGQGFSVLAPKRWNKFVHSRITALNDIVRDADFFPSENSKETHDLRRKALTKISSHAKLLVDYGKPPSFARRLILFNQFVFGAALSGSLGERIKFAITFCFPSVKRLKVKLDLVKQ
ncbi:glycosyltransferase family 2 protein (plasmid) [Cereibacter azotoformans]|uniref:glycosyltransferase family 2 protein n=1 Tax=Cereibacter azotoformans TaxID=43057 RepID=UPI003B226098